MARPAAPPAPRSAWKRSASSAWKPTPTARSSAATRAGRSTCSRSPAPTRCRGSAFEYPPQRRARRAQLLRRRREAGLPAQPVRRHARRSDRARIGSFFFVGYEALRRAARQDDLDRRPRRQRAPRALLPGGIRRAINPAVAPYLAEFPRANGPSLGQGLARIHVPVQPDGSISTFCRAASTTIPAPTHQFFARYTLDDANQFLPTDYPQFPRTFLPAISSSPANTGGSSRPGRSTRRASASAGRGSARTSRRTRPRRSRRSLPRPRSDGRHRHRRHEALRAAELGQPAAGAERVQRAERPGAQPGPPHAEGGRARRALPGQHGEPDVLARHLHLRRPERVPDEPARDASSA